MDNSEQQTPIKLGEYGRIFQQLCDVGSQIENPEEQQHFFEQLVQLMTRLNPSVKNDENLQQKLWNHIAFATDYKLNLNYPVEIIPLSNIQQPEIVAYAQHNIRLRHYGHIMAQFVQASQTSAGDEEKEALKQAIINKMKKLQAGNKQNNIDITQFEHDYAALEQALNQES